MSMHDELRKLAAEFDNAVGGTLAYSVPGMRKNAHDQLMYILSQYPETVSETEWAAGFEYKDAKRVQPYNVYRTQREAEAYVRSMNEVGAEMVVLTREHTPAVATEWRTV